MKKLVYLVASTLLVSFSLHAQTTVVLPVQQDAAIGFHDNFNTAGSNYGTAPQIAGYALLGTNGGQNVNRGLIQFDLSVIPTSAFVQSASLDLYAHGPAGVLNGHLGPNNSGLLQRVDMAWGELTTTWNSQPGSSTMNQVTLPASSSTTQDYLNIDVTNLVKDMLATNNYGFLLRQAVENPSVALVFASSDFADTLKHPRLTIVYELETSLEEAPAGETFQAFPNPATDQLNISFGQPIFGRDVSIEIYSLKGTLLESIRMDAQNTTIDVGKLAPGVYLLRGKVGDQQQTRKIVVSAR